MPRPEKAHAPIVMPAALDFFWREIFRRQTESIADSSSEEQSGEFFGGCRRN
jgi:hypothetical protein